MGVPPPAGATVFHFSRSPESSGAALSPVGAPGTTSDHTGVARAVAFESPIPLRAATDTRTRCCWPLPGVATSQAVARQVIVLTCAPEPASSKVISYPEMGELFEGPALNATDND